MNVLRRIPEKPRVDAKMNVVDVVCEGDGFHERILPPKKATQRVVLHEF
jgi:hypothetical protein